MKQTVIAFGILTFGVLVLVQLARISRFQSSLSFELWIVVFSAVFLGIGFFLNKKLSRPVVRVEQAYIENKPFTADEKELEKLSLSKRELEILQLISEGLSNQQIAGKLFLSENTVKKHISNLFFKMDVERRTEAVKRAKELRILA